MRRLAAWTFALSLLSFAPAFASPFASPVATVAWAQDDQPAQVQSVEFEAVEGPQQEDVSGLALMVASYAVVLLLMVLYVLRLGMIHATIARDVERLERSLASYEGDDAPKSAAAGDDEDEDEDDD